MSTYPIIDVGGVPHYQVGTSLVPADWYPHGAKKPHAAYGGFAWLRLGGHIGKYDSREEAEEVARQANASRQHGPEVTVEEVENVSYLIDFRALRPEMEARRENPAIDAILRHAEEVRNGSLECAWYDALEGQLGPDVWKLVNTLDNQLRKPKRSPSKWNVGQEPYYLHAPEKRDNTGDNFGWEGLHGD